MLRSLVFIFICLLILVYCAAVSGVNANSLVVGPDSNCPDVIDVPINKPSELNFKSKEEILKMRSQIVNLTPALLQQPYGPTAAIFDPIKDSRPWWGMQGTFIWGAGKRSIEGAAEESRFLLNPFLLIGANSGSALIWNTDKITSSDLNDQSFPYCWLPESLRWYANESLVQAKYDVASFNSALKARSTKLLLPTLQVLKFALIAYNARDFGYNYIFLDTSKSINVVAKIKSDNPVLIKQMIHCGKSCQYADGCNNMSPAQPEIDEFECTALPARANIMLWKEKPASKNTKADLTYYLDMH